MIMALIYKEASFPDDYREREVRQVMDAVYGLRSIAITGLAGMGKSNVVRFIVSHPHVRPRYLDERADDYAFVHVDCAGVARVDEPGIIAEIVSQLRHQGISASDAHRGQSPGRAASGLRRALRSEILDVEPNLNLVMVLDYFDQAAATLDEAFFNYLFYLRNARPRGNLSYILVTRRPLPHLCEMQELLDDGCIIGPLNRRDALDSIRRDETRLGCAFNAAQRDALIECTGGHPGLLKNACELLGSGKVDTGLSTQEMARQMLQSEKVKNLCEELWDDMTRAEQALLLSLVRGVPSPAPQDKAPVNYLKQSGMLIRKGNSPNEGEMAIFCPLFESFLHEISSATCGEVYITAVFPNKVRVQTTTGEEWGTLSPKLFSLLLVLTEARGHAIPSDEMISRVYGDEAAGVTNAALSQLVKRLRERVDPHVRRVTGDPTYTCVETIRGVGYRLSVEGKAKNT
jgi:DNA-binding winged helix-turn-helix (wHTH) protein